MTDEFKLTPVTEPWQNVMEKAVKLFIAQETNGTIGASHVANTPKRIVAAMAETVAGCKIDPAMYLKTVFAKGSYNQMIHVGGFRVISTCAHHGKDILGKGFFAYLPGDHIVGLSKIPRFIRALSKRLQVQEKLTEEIVDIFQEHVQPKGCAVAIRAYHLCMTSRGAEEPAAITETTALRGAFLTSPETRQEFLSSIDRTITVFP